MALRAIREEAEEEEAERRREAREKEAAEKHEYAEANAREQARDTIAALEARVDSLKTQLELSQRAEVELQDKVRREEPQVLMITPMITTKAKILRH